MAADFEHVGAPDGRLGEVVSGGGDVVVAVVFGFGWGGGGFSGRRGEGEGRGVLFTYYS